MLVKMPAVKCTDDQQRAALQIEMDQLWVKPQLEAMKIVERANYADVCTAKQALDGCRGKLERALNTCMGDAPDQAVAASQKKMALATFDALVFITKQQRPIQRRKEKLRAAEHRKQVQDAKQKVQVAAVQLEQRNSEVMTELRSLLEQQAASPADDSLRTKVDALWTERQQLLRKLAQQGKAKQKQQKQQQQGKQQQQQQNKKPANKRQKSGASAASAKPKANGGGKQTTTQPKTQPQQQQQHKKKRKGAAASQQQTKRHKQTAVTPKTTAGQNQRGGGRGQGPIRGPPRGRGRGRSRGKGRGRQ